MTLQHTASCHCGAVAFEFTAPATVDVTECNCSVCAMTGYRHVFVLHENLTFTAGRDHLSLYTFGSHQAQHYFCPTCGVKPLYQPRSHPEAWSVNLNCVKGDTLKVAKVIKFDGQNWEKNIAGLRQET